MILFLASIVLFCAFVSALGVVYHFRYRNSDSGEYDVPMSDYQRDEDWQWPQWTPAD